MFNYNPTVQNNSGETPARGQVYAAEALANARMQAAQIEAEGRRRRQQEAAQLIGTALSTGVGFAVGGPAGGALALAGGAAGMMGPEGAAIAPALQTLAGHYIKKNEMASSVKSGDQMLKMTTDKLKEFGYNDMSLEDKYDLHQNIWGNLGPLSNLMNNRARLGVTQQGQQIQQNAPMARAAATNAATVAQRGNMVPGARFQRNP